MGVRRIFNYQNAAADHLLLRNACLLLRLLYQLGQVQEFLRLVIFNVSFAQLSRSLKRAHQRLRGVAVPHLEQGRGFLSRRLPILIV